ncbi:hypothetical protein EDC01DRAFT_681523 [Geopyxis carbonaria]|nr:hypothetical protein EDC01DRAFT_681523 [Geopyxis carbonaria]
MAETYDFIIVGSGTSGTYLAHKLSTLSSPPASVLLLESGPDTLSPKDPANLLPLIPGNFIENVASTRCNYQYKTAPQAGLGGRQLTYHRGRGLGGTSTLNYMAWLKGPRDQFAEWSELVGGDSAYGPTEAWKRIKSIENFDNSGLSAEYDGIAKSDMKKHGTSGVIGISWPKNMIAGVKAFVEACEEAGIKRNLDINSGEVLGAGLVEQAVWKGARTSAATMLINKEGDLGAGLKRSKNLTVVTDCQVDRILFDGKKATGVQIRGGHQYLASKEVIVSGGVIDSPKLLLLSGVGPKDELEKLGIPVVHDSPYVGKNMIDHSTALVDVIFNPDLQIPTGNSLWSSPERVEQEKKTWLESYQSGKGEAVGEMTRFGSSAAVSFIRYSDSLRSSWSEWSSLSSKEQERFLSPWRPDTEIFYFLGYLPPGNTIPAGKQPNSYARLFLLPQNQLSRGSITLADADPATPPVIDPKYFDHPMDVRVAVETIKHVLKIFKTNRYRGIVKGIEFHGCADLPPYIAEGTEGAGKMYVKGVEETDEAIEKWLREKGLDQGYHGVGTMRMGGDGDPIRVTDTHGRVVGLQSLRVVDNSLVPVSLNNHPQVTAYLVADVVADRILEQWNTATKKRARSDSRSDNDDEAEGKRAKA